MPVFALNVFNLLPGKEDQYRDYSVRAGRIIYGLGGKVVSSGWHPVREMYADRIRSYFIVVEFPSEAVFQFPGGLASGLALHLVPECRVKGLQLFEAEGPPGAGRTPRARSSVPILLPFWALNWLKLIGMAWSIR